MGREMDWRTLCVISMPRWMGQALPRSLPAPSGGLRSSRTWQIRRGQIRRVDADGLHMGTTGHMYASSTDEADHFRLHICSGRNHQLCMEARALRWSILLRSRKAHPLWTSVLGQLCTAHMRVRADVHRGTGIV